MLQGEKILKKQNINYFIILQKLKYFLMNNKWATFYMYQINNLRYIHKKHAKISTGDITIDKIYLLPFFYFFVSFSHSHAQLHEEENLRRNNQNLTTSFCSYAFDETDADDSFFKKNKQKGFYGWKKEQSPKEIYELHILFLKAIGGSGYDSMLTYIKPKDDILIDKKTLRHLSKIGLPAAIRYLNHLDLIAKENQDEKELKAVVSQFLENSLLSDRSGIYSKF